MSIRDQVITAAKNVAENHWALGEALFQAKNNLNAERDQPIWTDWGYSSWYDYLENEVYLYVTPSVARNSFKVFSVFGHKFTTPSIRTAARKIAISKLVCIASLVTDENVSTWLKFVQNNGFVAVRDTAKLARMTPVLADDPDKCWARVQRLGGLPTKSRARAGDATVILTGLSNPQKRTFDWGTGLVRRVLKNQKLSTARCVAECLKQFKLLVETGRAGEGWSVPVVEVAA